MGSTLRFNDTKKEEKGNTGARLSSGSQQQKGPRTPLSRSTNAEKKQKMKKKKKGKRAVRSVLHKHRIRKQRMETEPGYICENQKES